MNCGTVGGTHVAVRLRGKECAGEREPPTDVSAATGGTPLRRDPPPAAPRRTAAPCRAHTGARLVPHLPEPSHPGQCSVPRARDAPGRHNGEAFGVPSLDGESPGFESLGTHSTQRAMCQWVRRTSHIANISWRSRLSLDPETRPAQTPWLSTKRITLCPPSVWRSCHRAARAAPSSHA